VLIEKGLVGVVRRGNGRSHAYLLCLPKRQAAALQVNAARQARDDDIPPFSAGDRHHDRRR
jgi:hypothetical protein